MKCVLGVLLALAAGGAWAQSVPVPPFASKPDMARQDYDLKPRQIAPDTWVIEGEVADFSRANGCNIINTGFIVGEDGVLVINTGPSRRYGEALRALIAQTTDRPVREVIHLNLHPDYFLGNQAFADVPRRATALTRAGIARESKAYEDNLYRVCGDWMLGTETVPPDQTIDMPDDGQSLAWRFAGRPLRLVALSGHTASDLVLIDETSGIMFAGGLVFARRIPTTPHANLPRWTASLDRLAALGPRLIVPSHGPVDAGLEGLGATRDYLAWLDAHFGRWAAEGRDLVEVLSMPVPDPYDGWAARSTEYARNVATLYPRYEAQALASPHRTTAPSSR